MVERIYGFPLPVAVYGFKLCRYFRECISSFRSREPQAGAQWQHNGGPRGPIPGLPGGGDGGETPVPDLPVPSEIGPGGPTARPRARRRP